MNEPAYWLIYGLADEPDTWPDVTRECLHTYKHGSHYADQPTKSRHRALTRAQANLMIRAEARCGNCLRRYQVGELP